METGLRRRIAGAVAGTAVAATTLAIPASSQAATARWKDTVLQSVRWPAGELGSVVVGAAADGTRVVAWERVRRLDPQGEHIRAAVYVSYRGLAARRWSRPRAVLAGLRAPVAVLAGGRHSVAIVVGAQAIVGDPRRWRWSRVTSLAPVGAGPARIVRGDDGLADVTLPWQGHGITYVATLLPSGGWHIGTLAGVDTWPAEAVGGPATTLLYDNGVAFRRATHGVTWQRLQVPIPVPPTFTGSLDGPSFWSGNELVVVGSTRVAVLAAGSSSWTTSPPLPQASAMVGRAVDGQLVAIAFARGGLVSAAWRIGAPAWTATQRVATLTGVTGGVRTGRARLLAGGRLAFVWVRCVGTCRHARVETVVRSRLGTWSPVGLVSTALGATGFAPPLTVVDRPGGLVVGWLDAPSADRYVGGWLRVARLSSSGRWTLRARRFGPVSLMPLDPESVVVGLRGRVTVAVYAHQSHTQEVLVTESPL
jgi:hypothetical protein